MKFLAGRKSLTMMPMPNNSALRWAGCLILLLGCAWGCARGPSPQTLPKMEIEAAGRRISIEIARTDDEKSIGMMFRKKLGPDEGMLFVYDHDRTLSFYMRNTCVPLSIAFLRADGTILNIEHMEPYSEKSHKSRLPCRFALEMPQGWFAAQGIKPGDVIGLPDF